MKSIVMEIHKDYCIVMTGDGRFIRQAVPAGELEIGDEIVIEEEVLEAPGRDWIKTFAIAAAAILVIGFGSYGIFKVFLGYGMGAVADTAVSEMEIAEEKAYDEAAVVADEEEASEEVAGEAAAAEESEDLAVRTTQIEGIEAGPGQINAEFDLDISNIGEPVKVVAGNLLFRYWAADSEEGMELLLTVEMLDTDLIFNGKIDASIVFDNGLPAGSHVFTLDGFSPGDRSLKFIAFQPGANTLHIKIEGLFE